MSFIKLTAKEAKTISEVTLSEKDTNQFNLINKAIDNAITNGEYSINVYESLRDRVRAELEGLGYVIHINRNQSPTDNSSKTGISWE